MVIKFAIEPNALIDCSGMSHREIKNLHRRIIRLWEQYGVLVDPGAGPNSLTSQFEHDVVRGVRDLWQNAWKTRRRCRRVRTTEDQHLQWADINSPSDLERYADLIELALVETVRGVVYLGIQEDDEGGDEGNLYSSFCGGVEATLFRYPEESQSFASLLDISQRTVIPAQRGRKAIWDMWFKNLAQKAREVVIIDRYGFSWNSFNGTCWALQFLTESMVDGVVTIYASDPSTLVTTGVSEEQMMSRIKDVLAASPNNLKSVGIFLVSDHAMTRDRYVRFDECAFSIGHGISETLRNEHLSQDTPCILDTSSRGVFRTMCEEVQRLVSNSPHMLRFEDGNLVND